MDHCAEQSVRTAEIVSPGETGIAAPAAETGRDTDTLTGCEPFDLGTDLIHGPGHIRSYYMGQDQGIGRIPLTGPNIKMVQGAGLHPHKYIFRTDHRLRKILIGQLMRSPMLTKYYGFHLIIPPPNKNDFEKAGGSGV
jgi:hypothetical protein